MTTHAVGKAIVTRIEETYQPVYDPKELFPEFTDEIFAKHKHWLAPNHYDVETRKVKLSVHSWLLQIGKQTILIDACCGNHKSRPTRPAPLFREFVAAALARARARMSVGAVSA